MRPAREGGENRGYVYRARVARHEDGLALLEWHVRRFPHSTREDWRARAEAGLLVRDGRPLPADAILREGDLLEWHRPPWQEPEAPSELPVLWEDEHLLAVDKPAGLQVLPGGLFLERTVLGLLRGGGPGREQWSPVHRLGRGTTGLQLVAKTPEAAASLAAQFRARSVEKLYLALVAGADAPGSWLARQPIGPVAHGGRRIHAWSPSGKASLTRLRVLARDRGGDRALVAARPVTGRADQIRIHLAASGHPLVGDPLFAAGGGLREGARPGDVGYLLRAVSLRLAHPADGRTVELRASPPAWARGVGG